MASSDRRTEADLEAAVPISDLFRAGRTLTDDEIAMEVLGRLRASAEWDSVDRRYIWPRNQLMVHGEQDISFNGYGNAWLRAPIERKRKPVRNIIQARFLDQTARLVQQNPVFAAAAENSDQGTRRKTAAAESLLYHRWRTCKIGHARRQSTRSALMKGMGIIEYGWDKAASWRCAQEPERGNDGAPLYDEEGGALYKAPDEHYWKRAEAEPVPGPYVNHVSPECFYPPPGVEEPTLNACRYLIRTMWMGEAQIREKFDVPKSEPLDDSSHGDSLPTMPGNWLSQAFGKIRSGSSHHGQYLVIQYFEPATNVRGFAYGIIYTVVGNKLVGKDRSQFRDGRYPFVIFPWLPRLGMFMCDAWVSTMVEPQIALNEGKHHAYTWLNKAANPNILAPQNSGIRDQIAFNFHTLYYQPGFGDVKMLQAPPLSPVVTAMMQDALEDIDRCSNQGPFLRGDPVPGVPAASYARMMAAAAASHLGQFNADWSESFADLGQGLLMLEREYGDDEQLAVIVGRSGRPNVFALKKTDLDDEIPIIVTESSLSVKSSDARHEMMLGLINAGIYNPAVVPEGMRKKLIAFMDMPDLNDIEDGNSLLTRFAEGAISRLIDEGMPVELSPIVMDEPIVLAALKDALVERGVGEDMWEWNRTTMGAAVTLKANIGQALSKLQQEAKAEAMQDQEMQLALMAKGEEIKSRLRREEKTSSIVSQVGADTIKEAHMPAPEKAPSNGAPRGEAR